MYGRLAQIRPSLVLTDDVAYYNGKEINVMDRVAQVTDDLMQDGHVDARPDGPPLHVVCLRNTRAQGRAEWQWKGKRVRW